MPSSHPTIIQFPGSVPASDAPLEGSALPVDRFFADEPAEGSEKSFQGFPANQSGEHWQHFSLSSIVLTASSFVFAAILASGWQAPLWFQPSCVGIVWGGLFLSGFIIGSVGRGKLGIASLSALYMLLGNRALQGITDIAAPDCLLVASCLMITGWITATFDSSCRCLTEKKAKQLTIWDLAFVTAVVACICHTVPRLTTHPLLLMALTISMVAGLLLSWFASRWVLSDQWSCWKLGAAACPFCIGLICVFGIAPDSYSASHVMTWLLTGPLNVIASQGTTVLVLVAAIRSDFGSWSPATALPSAC